MRNTTQPNTVTGTTATGGLPISLNQFARALDRTPCTIWRWRKLGWIREEDILNLASKPYISAAGVELFLRHRASGNLGVAQLHQFEVNVC